MNKKLLAIVLALSLVMSFSAAFAAEDDVTPIDSATVIYYVHSSSTEGSFLISIPSEIVLSQQNTGDLQYAQGTINVGVTEVVTGTVQNIKSITITTSTHFVDLVSENDDLLTVEIYKGNSTDAAPVNFAWKTSNSPAATLNADGVYEYLEAYTLKGAIPDGMMMGVYEGWMTFTVASKDI